MSHLPLSLRHLLALAVLLAAAGLPVVAAQGQSENSLREGISEDRVRERSLSSAARRLQGLSRAIEEDIALFQRRLDAAEEELAVAQAQLARAEARRDAARRRATRLRERLREARVKLATMLRERYKTPGPDVLTVVLRADGFADLLETVEFLGRVQDQDERVVDEVGRARQAAIRERRRLSELAVRRRRAAEAVHRRRDALAGIAGGLRERQTELREARAARLAALQRTRAGRRRAQRSLERLVARRDQAARRTSGPGGPWALPYAIVQCESGGQNTTPNRAGAAGYYQFLPETWAGLGGSTRHAYQAPKAEQDRLAARLWAGGSGAGNWDCAALVRRGG
ncbi:MAG TPA: transglycosylase family protein [Solirubrobacteraceae bacterium]|nr:transglycosylase family protein [Solirubrobacteraceae bacterium]